MNSVLLENHTTVKRKLGIRKLVGSEMTTVASINSSIAAILQQKITGLSTS